MIYLDYLNLSHFSRNFISNARMRENDHPNSTYTPCDEFCRQFELEPVKVFTTMKFIENFSSVFVYIFLPSIAGKSLKIVQSNLYY